MPFTNQHYTPTAITAAKPPIVTITDHGLSNGQRLRATNFVVYPTAVATGMEQLNDKDFVVQQVTTDTFELWDDFNQPIDASGFTAFVSNGLAQFTRTGPLLGYENEAA